MRSTAEPPEKQATGLPSALAGLFWDVAPGELSWQRHRDYIAERVLAEGSWDAITWLREELGDPALRELIRRKRGRLLSRPQLRFWQLILDLPEAEVDAWLAAPGRSIWDRRYK